MERYSIFVTVGTQLPFDRLIRMTVAAINADRFDLTVQAGRGGHWPDGVDGCELMSREAHAAALKRCDLVVTHCGIGAILEALQAGRPVVCLPRLHRLGEHRNDHQLATARGLRDYVTVVEDDYGMRTAINAWLHGERSMPELSVVPSTAFRQGLRETVGRLLSPHDSPGG